MPADRTAQDRYQERIDRLTAEHAEVQGRWSLLANVRLVLFVVFGVAIWQWWAGGAIAGWVVLATAIALVPLIVYHKRLRVERDQLDRLIRVNTLARDRAELRWDADLPRSLLPAPPPEHPYARDLNVVGVESLLRRIGTPVTAMGWRALQAWLLSPAPPETIRERQTAVRELGADIGLRQEIEQTGIGTDLDLDALENLLRWVEAPRLLAGRQWLLVLAWLGPLAVMALAVAHALGLIGTPLWVLALAFNLVVIQLLAGDIAAEVDRVGSASGSLRGYWHIVDWLAAHRPESSLLRSIHTSLFGTDGKGAGSIRRLARATSFVMPRGSLLYIPLQMAFAWDLHVAGALDRWKATSGKLLRGWFDTLGEWEALAALGVLAWDHPDWVFPTLTREQDRLAATNLRHPLLPVDIAVGNDVEIGPAGTFLFVTGSNMSGKSTLLRAAGANAVLAQAGGPVAAEAMTMPPVEIVTTMRVEDSLAHGVSFFLAELQRLKQVLDAADAARERPVLYLLDEILQGTNTAERQIASRRVLHHLTETTAIGAVSSHDLTLIEGSALEDRAVPVHFSEQFREDDVQPQMTFDYRLRPGLATSSNALKLMQMLGFPEE